MNLEDDRLQLIAHAIGRAVIELSLEGGPINREAIVNRLEWFRRETGNVIGKGVNRDAAELVRKGQ